jgi:SAM-dependent methyltransferase
MIKLDVCSNTKREGWDCIDVEGNADYQMDISERRLPFQVDSVDAIYSSHTLEHIWPDKLPFVLFEFRRVLKPGCPVRIVVPDFVIALEAYFNGEAEFLKKHRIPLPDGLETPMQHLTSWCFSYLPPKNGVREIGHKGGFDKDVIELLLNREGFVNIKHMKFQECSREFEGCDIVGHEECSLYVEAVKK